MKKSSKAVTLESSRCNIGEVWYKKADFCLSRSLATPVDTMGTAAWKHDIELLVTRGW